MGRRAQMCHFGGMVPESENQLTLRLINGLYVEAMVLADEARAYFDLLSHDARDRMTPLLRVTFSCESLKVTTRLMHVVAWLLSQRSAIDGSMRSADHRLGTAAQSDESGLGDLPEEARRIIAATAELYSRIQRLDTRLKTPLRMESPARLLQSRLMMGV